MKPQIVCFFTELLGPSLIFNLAQLVSPSVALPAELVHHLYQPPTTLAPLDNDENRTEQAGAELSQAQGKLELVYFD